MLASDVAVSMPPYATWFRGLEAVAAFLADGPMKSERRWRCVAARANGQLAAGGYLWAEKRETFAAYYISVLTLDGERISNITFFIDAS